MPLPEAVHEVISHFLTEFSPDQSICKTETYILNFLNKRYTLEVSTDIMTKFCDTICKQLIDEHDRRIKNHELLRFKFADDEGKRVAGIGLRWQSQLRVFQDAVNDITDSEFEALSAHVLLAMGCNEAWITPSSHDQGLDSFGYADLLPRKVPLEISCQCRAVYLAQAKHYKKHKIGSKDIREFVGSVELAIYKIFSTEDQKYQDLVIRPFGPHFLVFVTTEELPLTVKTMGKNAGIVVLTSQDLAVLFARTRLLPAQRWRRDSLARTLKKKAQGMNTAK